MIEKWYRGHEGDRYATDNFGIIWLADDPDYAKLYADEYPNGVVSTLFIDTSKLKYLDWYYNEDFDPYDPDMSLIKEYMNEEGCNAYTFPLNDGTTVLALLSMEPIVKVENTIVESTKPKQPQKWYRGHDASADATDNFGVIWLTSDPNQAEVYAEMNDNGVVSEITVDMNKLNIPQKLYKGFDVWEPGWEEFRYLEELGCNGYIFNINDVKCLALLSKEPIINVSLYNDNEDSSVEQVGINEIRYMVKEVINKILTNKK